MDETTPRWRLSAYRASHAIVSDDETVIAAYIADELDARLFLAARELKTALEAQARSLDLDNEGEHLCFCDGDTGNGHWPHCRMATAALAKAEGRS